MGILYLHFHIIIQRRFIGGVNMSLHIFFLFLIPSIFSDSCCIGGKRSHRVALADGGNDNIIQGSVVS